MGQLYVDVRGRQVSAASYMTEALATRVWQRAEDRQSERRGTDTRRARQRFRRYVEEQWLSHQ